jgi:hypothetical protein
LPEDRRETVAPAAKRALAVAGKALDGKGETG